MQTPLELGDKVRHKSGGPVMTVELCRRDAVHCVWYEGREAHSASFAPDDLDLVLRKDDVPDSRPAPLE